MPTQSAAAIKILAATLYIFISQVLPALTFALLLSEGTNGMMGAAGSIVGYGDRRIAICFVRGATLGCGWCHGLIVILAGNI